MELCIPSWMDIFNVFAYIHKGYVTFIYLVVGLS